MIAAGLFFAGMAVGDGLDAPLYAPKGDTAPALFAPVLAPAVLPAHSPDAGVKAWLVGLCVGVAAGSVTYWSVSREYGPGWGVGTGLGVGGIAALGGMMVSYVLLE